jgi:acyl carrier protein
MTAADVPGWDSLNHSILMMELGVALGVDISAEETAKLANIGALLDYLNERAARV